MQARAPYQSPRDRARPPGREGRPSTLSPMAKTRVAFGRDTGLQFRMLLTMFLLGLLYVFFV